MAICEYCNGCAVYSSFKTEFLRNLYLRRYCEGDPGSCQRRGLRVNGQPVPPDLLPDGRSLGEIHVGRF